MDIVKQVLEILSALLTPTIGVVGVVVLVNQYRLERLRWRLALFDKRYAVYLAVSRFLSNIMATANVTNDQLFTFLRETRDQEFLFGKEIHDFIDKLYLRGVDLDTVNKTLESTPVGEERNRLVDQSSKIFHWFRDQFAESRKLFGEYLSIDKK